MKKALTLLPALCLMLALCACGPGGSSSAAPTSAPTAAPTAAPTPTAKPTPEPTPEPTPDPEAAEAALDEVKDLFDHEEYYEAALRIRDCQELYPDTEAAEAAGELMDKIAAALKDKEPKTGELERRFPYHGMSIVRATAEHFPFEMTIRDAEDERLYVRFYVRQGDTSEIYLPSAQYHVSIKTGPVWFDDEIGFGELGEASDYEGGTLDMTSFEKYGVPHWHEWTPVF